MRVRRASTRPWPRRLIEVAGVDLLHVAGDALAVGFAGDLLAIGGLEARLVAADVAEGAGEAVVLAHDHPGGEVRRVVLHAAALHVEFEVLAAHLLGVAGDGGAELGDAGLVALEASAGSQARCARMWQP